MGRVAEWDGVGVSPILYAKSAIGAVNVWQCWADGDTVVCKWGQEGGTMQEAPFVCEGKNPGKKNETTPEQQAIKEALAKFKKQRKKKYFLKRKDALGALNCKPMLAKSFKDRGQVSSLPQGRRSVSAVTRRRPVHRTAGTRGAGAMPHGQRGARR